jgi:hypothetical protein
MTTHGMTWRAAADATASSAAGARRPWLGVSVPRTWDGHAGASLLEVLVAGALLAVLLASAAPLVALAAHLTHDAHVQTGAVRAARNHAEALRALPWWHGDAVLIVDTASDLARDEFSSGGAGLAVGSLAVLEQSTPGYEDQLDGRGLRVSEGRLLRRWTVLPSPAHPACVTLIVEVARAERIRSGRSMATAASARAQTTRCAAGWRP